ncbi:MAG: substrate-binding domain-containing protein [Lachnospiraceae bacterium]|nr:substrate-binding domain-containing protein [Lachnospiraceae bacterium]
MKTSKKVLALLLVFVLCVAAMAGCGAKEDTPAETTTQGQQAAETTTAKPADDQPADDGLTEEKITAEYKFALMLQNTWNPFFTEIRVGIDDALTAKGVDTSKQFQTLDGNSDIAKQINDLEDLISAGVNVVFLNTCDSTGIDASAKKAVENGMILIAIDTPQDNPEPLLSTVASDNYGAGVLCAQELAKALENKGDCGAYLRSTSKVAALRGNGFCETIEADYPDMQVVNKQEGTAGSADAALPCMENILQANPDITGMFALNDPSAQGCISAIKSAGKIEQIKVVAVDGSKEAKQLVLAGEQLGSAAQFPGEMGKLSVESAYTALLGGSVDAEQLIPTQWMDISNAATMKNYDYDN